MKFNSVRFFMWVAIVCLLAGCVMVSRAARVDVRTINKTNYPLGDVAVWFGVNNCDSGYLGVGGQATNILYPAPITRSARVEWRDEVGRMRSMQVDLADVYRAGQSGILEIAIMEGGVVAQMKPLPSSP